MELIECQRQQFLLPEYISYINCAYMSPLPKKVVEAGKASVEQKAFPFRIKPLDFFETIEELRSEFAKIISTSAEDVAIIPSVSYGIASIAKNIKLNKGDEILVLGEQFPSNFYSWQRLANESGAQIITIQPPEHPMDRGRNWNAAILNAISERTRLVAIGTVHWSDGTLYDLTVIREKSNKVGAYLILDGTQSVGAMPIDIEILKPDALIVAGYKWLMCPYSISFAWYGERFKEGIPLEESWVNRNESQNFAGLINYQENFDKGARRFDMGEKSNFILNPMALEALKLINYWGPDNIQRYCANLIKEPVKKIEALGYWVENSVFRGSHLFGIRVPEGTNLEKIKLRCEEMNVYVSIRGSAIRVSPNIYNDENDFNKLIEALS